jgi:hypothetical protein
MNLSNIILWHGSTKKFDQFDISMVGSGDNSSLGGWGIYFSDNKTVSMRYFLPSGQIKQYKLRSGEYFDLDKNIDADETQRIYIMLQRMKGISPKDLEEFNETYVNGDNYSATNKNVYDWLTYVLKSDKNASMFLDKLGYIGNTMLDKWQDNTRNYIVFNTDTIIGEVEEPDENDEENIQNDEDQLDDADKYKWGR